METVAIIIGLILSVSFAVVVFEVNRSRIKAEDEAIARVIANIIERTRPLNRPASPTLIAQDNGGE